MEKLDLDRELQVWQRVNGGPRPEGGDIRYLLHAAVESVAAYRQLTGLLTGKPREQMRGLLAAAQRSLAGLKGIQIMSGHPAGDLRTVPVSKEATRRLLEKSFHRSLRQMTEYTARALDPEYGVVYQTLADREREAAAVLAELVGDIEK